MRRLRSGLTGVAGDGARRGGRGHADRRGRRIDRRAPRKAERERNRQPREQASPAPGRGGPSQICPVGRSSMRFRFS